MPILRPQYPILQRGHRLARDLIAAWTLGDGGQFVSAIDHANGIVGTASGILPTPVSYNDYGSALWFDTSRFVTPTVNHNIGAGDFTISVLLNPSSLQAYRGIFAVGTYDPALYIAVTGGQWGIYWGSDRPSGNTLTTNRFYLLSFQRNGSTVSLWQDGIQTATTHTISTSMANTTLTIGDEQAAGSVGPFYGEMAAVYFYRRALSPLEHNELAFDPFAAFRFKPPQIFVRLPAASGALIGTGAITTTSTATLSGQGTLIGATQTALTASAVVSGLGALITSAGITLVATAALTGIEFQYGRPSEDISIGGWTTDTGATTNLYDSINESIADDNDYIRSSTLSSGSDTCEVRLNSLIAAEISTFHIVRYRLKRIVVSGDRVMNHTVALYEGATEIASWQTSSVGTDWQTIQHELTEVQVGAITDYGNLRLRFTATAVE